MKVGVLAAAVAALAGCSSSGSNPSIPPTGPTSSSGAGPASPTTPSAARGPAAVLTGPITTGHLVVPLQAVPVVLPAGYVEQELFASGTAHAYTATSTPADGRWTVSPGPTAAYETRLIVRRPADPAAFNGTVVVEWMNVSSGEAAPDWQYLNPMLTADGYAYVGVSAQELGVEGGRSLLGRGAAAGLKGSEPERYGALHHPGDQYAYDIYAQIGQALRTDPAGALGELRPRHVVAVGESQSAIFLTTYADAIQPRTSAYDGFFIHSRAASGASLTGSITAATSGAQPIRTDLGVPVFLFETESDLTTLGYAAAQQPDSNAVRTWEVAGTAHADRVIVGGYASLLGCTTPVNSGPQHEVIQAAFTAFARWVTDGTLPPTAPRLQVKATMPATLRRDANGNALGGVRTPAVDVPIAALSGEPVAGATLLCQLFGSTVPFSAAKLEALYGSSAGYVARYTKALDSAITDGFILKADRAELLHQAAAVPIGGG